MSMAENPYASPEAAVEPVILDEVEISDAEQTRREYLNHETSIRSIGSLYFLSVIFLAPMCFVFLADRQPIPAMVAGVMAALMIFVGRGVRKLEPWTRIPVGILATFGLLALGLGTIINAYILYLVFCRKGQVVFSPAYASVIRQTPHIKYRTSFIVKFFVALLFIVIVLGVLGFLLGGK